MSKGWVNNFSKRHALRTIYLAGEAGSVHVDTVVADMVELRKELAEYKPSCIFNIDETGLFYNILPNQTYIGQIKDGESVGYQIHEV